MKNFSPLALIFLVSTAFGQTLFDFGRVPGVNIKPNAVDTTLRIIYVNKTNDQKLPAFYLDGRLVKAFSVAPGLIDILHVDNDSIQIGNVMYYGQIHITTKKSYHPKFISLTELKEKYTDLNNEPAIFIVDGEIITSDYDEYVIDENHLWRIFIDKIENEKEKINFKVIKLLTKSEENLGKPAEIRIRGMEMGLIK